jgi:PEGA domain-containing protein
MLYVVPPAGGRSDGTADREDASHEASLGSDRLNGTGPQHRTSMMSRAIVVVAGGFGLAACSFAMPSMDFFSSKPTTASLSIESNPPGADARLSIGGTCRTPCSQTVSLGSEFTVTVALNGYMPETRTVKPVSGEASAGSSGGLLDPNPLFVELKPNAPPPKPAPPKKKRKRPIQSAAPAAPQEAPPPQTGFVPAPGGFGPPPGQIR